MEPIKKIVIPILLILILSVSTWAVCSTDRSNYIFYDHTMDGTNWTIDAGTPTFQFGYLGFDANNELAYINFTPNSNNIITTTYQFQDSNSIASLSMSLMSGGITETTQSSFFARDDQTINEWCLYDGLAWNCAGTKTINTWYDIEIINDLVTDTSTVSIDGTTILTDEDFRADQTSIDRIYFKMVTTDGTAKVTNISIFEGDTCPGEGIGYFQVTAKDQHTGKALKNFSVYMNSTEYATTNGTLNTPFVRAPDEYTIELRSTDNGGYFNTTYVDYNISSDLEAATYQTEIRINSFELISNNPLSQTFQNSTGASLTLPVYYRAGKHNLSFVNNLYFTKTAEFDIPALFNGTLNITDISGSIINITVVNGFNGLPLENFTGYAYNKDQSHNTTINATGTYQEVTAISGNYTVYVELNGYALDSNNYQNVTVNSKYTNVTFSLWSNNSIRVFIRDEITNALITDNISIVLTGNSSETTQYTTNGTYFFSELLDGEYTLKFSGVNYTVPKTYAVTVADRSTQILNAYLAESYQTVIFTVSDQYTSATLEGASLTAARLINSTYTTTESKSTDITGRAQVSYLPNVKYRFTITLAGYANKIFYLDPVIFSSYTVPLERTSVANYVSYDETSISFYPVEFWNGKQNNFTFIFGNPSGALSSYGFNVSYPGGSIYRSGVNAIGEQFDINFTIAGATLFDTVNLTYWYTSTLAGYKFYSGNYWILGGGASAGNYTAIKLKEGGSDIDSLGPLEKALIALFFVTLVTGFGYMAGGEGVGAGLGLITWGIFSYLGFIPLWAILPAILAGFIFIGGKNG